MGIAGIDEAAQLNMQGNSGVIALRSRASVTRVGMIVMQGGMTRECRSSPRIDRRARTGVVVVCRR